MIRENKAKRDESTWIEVSSTADNLCGTLYTQSLASRRMAWEAEPKLDVMPQFIPLDQAPV